MKAYFADIKLKTGEWVTIVYESESRKNTLAHKMDLWNAVWNSQIDYDEDDVNKCADRCDVRIYLMNAKNKAEQCFGDLRIIDMR